MSENKEVASLDDIRVSDSPKEHSILLTNGKVFKVWLKEPTWFDRQYALSGWVDIDQKAREAKPNFAEYYRRLLEKCFVRSEPAINVGDIFQIRPEIGEALEKLLPSPVDIGITPEEEKKS